MSSTASPSSRSAWAVWPGERRALQVTIFVLALLPILAGMAGMIQGPALLRATPPWPADLDSHVRFLSGVLFAIGMGWWSCVPGIERRTERLRLLAALTFVGGLARLASLGFAGAPSTGHRAGLIMELAVVPALVIWHSRIASAARRK